ncbi:MAG: adenylate/guanylate cyclase domain-containing protein [Chitinophagales bacterium]
MKRTLYCLLLFVSMQGVLQAQYAAKADSLLKIIQTAKSFALRKDACTELSYLAYDDSSFRTQYILPALAASHKAGDKCSEAVLYLWTGRYSWKYGRFSLAVADHQKALELLSGCNDLKYIAVANRSLGQDFLDSGKYDIANKYLTTSLRSFTELEDTYNVGLVYQLISYMYQQLGDNVASTDALLKGLKSFEEAEDTLGVAVSLANLGDAYVSVENYTEGLKYYQDAVKILVQIDTINAAISYGSMGDILEELGKYADAIPYYRQQLDLGTKIHDAGIQAAAYLRIGKWFVHEGQEDSARVYFQQGSNAYHVSGFSRPQLAELYVEMVNLYVRQKNYASAEIFLDSVHQISEEIQSKLIYAGYYHALQKLDSVHGRWEDAFAHYKLYILYQDSIQNLDDAKKVVSMQMQYNFDKKEAATKAEQEKKDLRQKTIRNAIALGLLGALIFLVVVARQRNKIGKEKKRSDNLLLNILPEEVADELKEKGSADAKQFDDVTVMFTDFKGFTTISEKLSARELVSEIDTCFKAFDNIIAKYGLEKIKTIGDSYMCAGGLPVPNKTHAMDVVRAAMEILQFMEEHLKSNHAEGKEAFEIRIGIHTGPVVAGIVGVKKFAYDIWGDTVNIASRMESSGEAGKVNISGSTYAVIKNSITCTFRGKIPAKNKGDIEMYFVDMP